MDTGFLKHRVRDAVVSDIVDVAHFHADRNTVVPFGGCFGIPRDVFCIVDFLGAVAYADDQSKREDGASSRKAVEFLNDYFPERYRPFATLIVHMWRHGTVHNFQPLTYVALLDGTRVTLTWTSNNGVESHNRAVHLRLLDVAGQPGVVSLSMNVLELAQDLVRALDKFVDAMDADASFEEACTGRLASLLEPREVESLPRAGNDLKRLLSRQIGEAHEATDGTLSGVQVECPTDGGGA